MSIKVLIICLLSVLFGCVKAFAQGSLYGAPIWTGISASIAAATTDFLAVGQGQAEALITSEANAQNIVPFAGTASNLYCFQTTAANTNTPVYTVRKKAGGGATSSTTLTCTILNTATTCNDTTHNFTFAAGDSFDIQIANPASANATGVLSCGFRLNG